MGLKRFKKLREHQYREEYARGREYNGMEKIMWESVKRGMVESAREVCSSVRVGGKNSKSV